jgi:hypothetical protein
MSRKPYGYQILRSDDAAKRIGLDAVMGDDPQSLKRGAIVMDTDTGSLTLNSGCNAAVSNDTTNVLFATTARRITVGSAGGSAELRATINPAVNAVDLDTVVHICFYVHSSRTSWSTATLPSLSLRFGTTINNRTRYQNIFLGASSGNTIIHVNDLGRFYIVSIPLSRMEEEQAAFDPTTISWLGFGLNSYTVGTSGTLAGTGWFEGDYVTLDSIIFTNTSPARPANGAAVIHVDDFRKATADIIVPIANEKGINLTFPIISSSFGTTIDTHLIGSAAELAAAVRAGHGVMCHTNGATLTGMNAAQQRTFMMANQEYLLDFAKAQGVNIGDGWRHQTTHTGYHDSYSTQVWHDLFDTVCTQRETPTSTSVTKNIADVTLNETDPVLLTVSSHGFSTNYDGAYFEIKAVEGVTGLNDAIYEIEYVDTNTLKLQGTDSSDFGGEYTSGGTIRLARSHMVNPVVMDPFAIRRYVLSSSVNIDDLKAQLRLIKQQKGIVVFYLHDVAEASGDMTTANFTALLDFLNDISMPIWTQEELGNYMRFGTPDYVEMTSASSPSGILGGRGIF